jgi:two-component system nitrogen regulation sensor histidine kinase NtrY
MNRANDWRLFRIMRERRFREIGIVFFICGALAVSKTAEYLLLRHYEQDWEQVVEKQCSEYLQRAEQTFTGVQRSVRRVATEIAQHPLLLTSLLDTASHRIDLYEYVSRISRDQNVGVEVYNRTADLIAWEGRSRPDHLRDVRIALAGQLTSYVSRTPLFSQLFVATPVRQDGRIIGAVLVRRTIEVNYPLSNRFINREGITEQLRSELGVAVEMNFADNAEPRKDGRYVSAVLRGIDGNKVGIVSVLRPARSAYLEGVRIIFDQLNGALLTALIAFLMYTLLRRILSLNSTLVRSLALTALIWTVRYALLWIDVTALYSSGGIFDPGLYASKFGTGLAKSPGELLITCLALVTNVVVVSHFLLQESRKGSPWSYSRNGPVRVVLAVMSVTLVYLLLRGYAAAIRSAVFDSTFHFNDPKVIVPSFEMAIMVFNLFALSFSLIVVAVGLTSFVLTQCGQPAHRGVVRMSQWLLTAGLLALASVLFGVLQVNPLMSLWFRLLFGACILGLTYHLHYRAQRGKTIVSFGNFVIALGLSALFFYPLLDRNVHEKDRERVEAFADQVLRPVDSWLKFLVDEALQGFISDDVIDVLTGDDREEMEQLAFSRWAKSTISREGYTCMFAIVDSLGRVRSRFKIGSSGGMNVDMIPREVSSPTRVIRVTQTGSGVGAVKVYSGSVPITTSPAIVIAHGVVVLAAGQQALFRGETPPILRSAGQDSPETFYRPVSVSEFRNGVLFASPGSVLPLGYRLPATVEQTFKVEETKHVWMNEVIDNVEYETLFARRPGDDGTIVALALQRLGMEWHLFSVVKVIVYYSIVILVVLGGFVLLRWVRREPYTFTFRDKLLGAFLVTALIPLMIIAYYTRVFAGERLLEGTAHRLELETATVGTNIMQHMGSQAMAHGRVLDNDAAEQLAAQVGTDFNFYIGNELQSSSRPELYDVGILDKRLNGSVYASLVARGKRFHLETENIGTLRYAVGYRSVTDASGHVAGVVSVPTIYRQDELDEEVSKQNALIFGVYAVIVFVVIVIATTLANRIAAPIHRLKEATARVSKGDLDVTVTPSRADGEIGELITSFDKMTKDLKRSRDDLVRYEREMAWREMAKQVAHEIKNPLTPMKLSLQHLRQTYKDKVADFDHIFEEVSKTIVEQIDALSHIASEFSRFARMPKPELEPCDINAILQESVHLFERDESVQFQVELGTLPPAMADREELRRAFINIIRNGIQAMNGTGRMFIRTALQRASIMVAIQDLGSGISNEVKTRLFEPNFSTRTDGMGLGLALVKRTIDDLNGEVSIESELGKGTTVIIRIPSIRPEA